MAALLKSMMGRHLTTPQTRHAHGERGAALMSSSSSSFIGAGQLFQPHRSTSGGFRVGGGDHDSYTFQCGLVGYFSSPGIDTR